MIELFSNLPVITFFVAIVVYNRRRKMNRIEETNHCKQNESKYSSEICQYPSSIVYKICHYCCIYHSYIIVISYLGTEVNTDFDIENLYLENLTMNAISRQLQHFNLSEAFVSILVFIQCQILLMFLFGINLIVWLKKLETIPKFGMGSNETVLWTRDFANAIAFWDDESNFWQQDKLLSTFREYEIDEKFVITEKRKDGVEVISGFFWSITYRNLKNFWIYKSLCNRGDL
ncbi:hypothetical protein ACO02O_10978 [Dirofilaria immitis]